jgi:hypothetical protein
VRSKFGQMTHADGRAGARKNGGAWEIDAAALRTYMQKKKCREAQTVMLERVIEQSVVAPRVPADGPPPPLSAAIEEWLSEERAA